MKKYEYVAPSIDLLANHVACEEILENEKSSFKKKIAVIDQIFKIDDVNVKIENIRISSNFTSFEVILPEKVNYLNFQYFAPNAYFWLVLNNKICVNFSENSENKLEVTLPNKEFLVLGLKETFKAVEDSILKKGSFNVCIGENERNEPLTFNLKKFSNLLISGTAGSGKTQLIYAIITSLLYNCGPDDLRLIIADPKLVEFKVFKSLPHLMFKRPLYSAEEVSCMLHWLVEEMENRYGKFRGADVRNIDQYNEKVGESEKLPRIAVVIDELTDFIIDSTFGKGVENSIHRLIAKSRAAGIHIIAASQRINHEMNDILRCGFYSRIALRTLSYTDSLIALGEGGAEMLEGNGDCFVKLDTYPSKVRGQCAYVTFEEIRNVCAFIAENNNPLNSLYDGLTIEQLIEEANSKKAEFYFSESNQDDKMKDLIKDAMRLAIKTNAISISALQRKLSIGFPKAGKLLDTLVELGYVSDFDENKNRKIYITKEQFEEIFGEPL